MVVGCALMCSPSLAQRKSPPTPKPKLAPSAAPRVSALPVFTFKQAHAGEVMDPSAVGKCGPQDDGIPGKIECSGTDNVVAGVGLLVAPTYYFFQGRLTSVLFLYDNNSTNFLTFLAAFREKYGAPCATETKKWQSRGGVTLDNSTATWCFKTGKLKLEEIGPSLKYGLVSYDDDYSAPSKSAPQDF